MSELKPCPCCNGKAERTEDVFILPTSKIVYCGACGLRTKSCATWEEAEFDWNRRAQPANDPLTLEQLREMDGEPVRIEGEYPDRWHICYGKRPRKRHGRDVINFGNGVLQFEDEYGKTWLAYRRKPEGRAYDSCLKNASEVF